MSNKPPTQDTSRNEYIPSYITKAPFYAEGLSDGDYLEHQRLHAIPKDTIDQAKWYERGRKVGPAATKYRKGACENCGAMSHKTKDCLERPRKHGAKWTGRDIKADEAVAEVKLGFDAKRDRWNGYDAREYSAVVREYEEMEDLRQNAAGPASQKLLTENDDNEDGLENDDKAEAKYGEETDMGRSQATSTRQLRLREDTAKYLLNLDLDSARYDPKTRSMDTTAQTLSNNPSDSVADENFIRPAASSDGAAAFERAQKYAWETQESSNANANAVATALSSSSSANAKKLHLQANPTEGELLIKKRDEELATKKAAQRKALIDKYGEQAHLPDLESTSSTTNNPHNASSSSKKPKAIPSSESYTEYDKHGNPKPAGGRTTTKPRSKYLEDVLINNHTSVFGSWWANFTWGYSCCHSTVRNSYCTGDAGRAAFEESEGLRMGQTLLLEDLSTNSKPTETENKNKENGNKAPTFKTMNGEKTQKLDLDLEQNLEQNNGDDSRYRKTDTNADADLTKTVSAKGSNKRTFGHVDSVTEEELETYKRNRMAANDPMASLGATGEDGLLRFESS